MHLRRYVHHEGSVLCSSMNLFVSLLKILDTLLEFLHNHPRLANRRVLTLAALSPDNVLVAVILSYHMRIDFCALWHRVSSTP